VHPSLLPKFPGAHAVRDALSAGAAETGVTIHVVDAGIDTGTIIAQRAVKILPADDQASLHERIKIQERELLVETVLSIAQKRTELASR
jgi:phosphoribosylglycinamide formyltransferase-1